MPKTRTKLSAKQRIFVDKYIETKGNGTQSALQAYDTNNPSTAGMIASDNLRKPYIQEEIVAGFEKAGLTKQKVFELFSESMIKSANTDQAKMSDAMKAFDLFFKVTNMYPQNVKKVQHESIKLVFDGKNDKELNELLKERLKLANQYVIDDTKDVV